jgi:hypothetical protein
MKIRRVLARCEKGDESAEDSISTEVRFCWAKNGMPNIVFENIFSRPDPYTNADYVCVFEILVVPLPNQPHVVCARVYLRT